MLEAGAAKQSHAEGMDSWLVLLMRQQNDAIKIIYVSNAEFETGNLSSSDTENLFLE